MSKLWVRAVDARVDDDCRDSDDGRNETGSDEELTSLTMWSKRRVRQSGKKSAEILRAHTTLCALS